MNKPASLNPNLSFYPPPPSLDDESAIELPAVIAFARRRLIAIATIAEVIFFAALIYALSREPAFEGRATLLLESQGGVEELLELDPDAPPPQSNQLNNQIEILRSTNFLEGLVARNDFLDHPEFAHLASGEPATDRSPLGRYLARFGLTALDPRQWFDGDREDDRPFTAAELGLVLAERLEVATAPDSDVVAVRFAASTPEHAAEIANLIVDDFLADRSRLRAEATERANQFLAERLDDLRQQVREAEGAVADFAAENQLLEDSDGNSITDRSIEQVSEQLADARAEVASAEARLRRLESVSASGASPEAILEVVSSDVIERLREERGDLRRTLSDYQTRYRDGHPEMIRLRDEIWEVEQQIFAELERITASVRSDLQVAQSRAAAIEEEVEGLRGDLAEAGVARVELRELQRNADSARALYETFLNRSAEINQQAELERGDARVISRARPPQEPSGPRTTVLLGVGAILALSGGVGGGLVLEMLDRGMRRREELERFLGVGLLASIPLIERRKWRGGGRQGPTNLVVREPLGAFAESIRTLRSSLSTSDLDRRTKCVLFTSSLPSEGKTTTAVAMARSAAEARQKVLLIDCDLRNSHVAQATGLKGPGDLGLTHVLAGEASISKAVREDSATPLHVLTAGKNKKIPTDIFGSEAFRRLLDEVRDAYDLVVLDAAPVLAVTDTRQAASLVDAVVFVVAWASTPRDAAAHGLAALRDSNAPVRGAIFTMMNLKKMKRYGYGDAAFYHSRYSVYYAK